MARVNNPQLGTIQCPDCDGVASVHQTSRGAGRFLYTRCPKCGPDQRTGAQVQTRLWNRATWDNGEPDVKPPNLIEGAPAPVDEPGEQPAEPEADSTEEPSESKGSGLFWMIGGALGLAALVLRGGQ